MVRRGFFFPSSFAPDHHSMAITRRQCQKQIVLVCFHDISLLLQVNRVNAEGLLQESSPIATNLVYLPDSFQPLVHFLQHKAGRSYYQNIIKKALIKISTNFSEGFDALCSKHFPTQCSVVDWCINVVVNNYISETAAQMSGRLKFKYLLAAEEAKGDWLIKRQTRLQQEKYLCNNDFRAELVRSYAEYFEELRKAIGCAPMRWFPII
jgi:hypothetical protein